MPEVPARHAQDIEELGALQGVQRTRTASTATRVDQMTTYQTPPLFTLTMTAEEAAECAPNLVRFFDILTSRKCPRCGAPAWIRCDTWALEFRGGMASSGAVCLIRIPACGITERQALARLAHGADDPFHRNIRRAFRAWRFLLSRRR